MPFEVVPGVTLAVAVPAYAGIPVTHRGLASSLAVVTGHEDPDSPSGGVDWSGPAACDSIVCLMGVERLPAITAQPTAHGVAPETPAAVIRSGHAAGSS